MSEEIARVAHNMSVGLNVGLDNLARGLEVRGT